MNLLLLIWIPLATTILVLLSRNATQVKWLSLIGSAAQLVVASMFTYSVYRMRTSGDNTAMFYEMNYSWFPHFGIDLHVGVDGISVAMLMLTAIVVFAGVLVSWNVHRMTKEFFLLLLLLSMGAYGFFISLNLFTMFFFLELAVLPKFLLIGIWGSGKKEYSAMKLALMLMTGSALVLIGLLCLYFNTHTAYGGHTFDLMLIAQQKIPVEAQRFIFPLMFVGFGIFTALFPFHTWVPDGHSSAPTAASMFLAGISMKLGGYGCLRVATYLMPEAAHQYAPIIILLSTIAIIYGAFATLMQKDLKYINAYSSVSHCGFVLFGIGILTKTAIVGAVMQMVSHGLMTALFFAAIGMIYERTHTRQVSELGGLLKSIPFIMTVFAIAGLCSLGLPGLSGFVSEMTVFMGAWQRADNIYHLATILACASIVVTAVYILRAVGQTAMGPIKTESYLSFGDAKWNEKLASGALLLAIFVIGILPFLLTQLVSADTQTIMNNIGRAAQVVTK